MSQKSDILNHLKQGNKITPLEALSMFGCFRLATRIFELKKEGHDIRTDMIERNNKRFAQYSLITEPEQVEIW